MKASIMGTLFKEIGAALVFGIGLKDVVLVINRGDDLLALKKGFADPLVQHGSNVLLMAWLAMIR